MYLLAVLSACGDGGVQLVNSNRQPVAATVIAKAFFRSSGSSSSGDTSRAALSSSMSSIPWSSPSLKPSLGMFYAIWDVDGGIFDLELPYPFAVAIPRLPLTGSYAYVHE